MSRSRLHTPIIGNTTARSEATSKRFWSRTYRRAANRSDDPLPQKNRGDRDGAKDGKYWLGDTSSPLMRK